MHDWIGTLTAVRRRRQPAVLVTVAVAKGAAPRGSGERGDRDRSQRRGIDMTGGHG